MSDYEGIDEPYERNSPVLRTQFSLFGLPSICFWGKKPQGATRYVQETNGTKAWFIPEPKHPVWVLKTRRAILLMLAIAFLLYWTWAYFS